MKNLRFWCYLILILFLTNCKSNKNSTQNNTFHRVAESNQKVVDTISTKSLDSVKIVKIEKPAKINLLFQEPEIVDKLPSYDINNLPISFWLLKEGNSNVGFIVAGHAYKEVCQLASFEVLSEIDKMGKIDTTIFTYGVGFDLRDRDGKNWNSKYDSLLTLMNKKFEKLSIDHPDQAIANVIDFTKYKKTQELIRRHIYNANSQKSYDTHIVEYKYDNSPLIVPFYDVRKVEPVTFNISKDAFGVIPVEITKNQVIIVLDKLIKEIKGINKVNREQLNKLSKQGINDESDFFDKSGFKYSLIKFDLKKGINIEDIYLESYEKGPGGDLVAPDGTSRYIKFNEAKLHLNDSRTRIEPSLRVELEAYVKKEPIFIKKFTENKRHSIFQFQNEIKANDKVIEALNSQKVLYNNKFKDNFLYIDAFLRGWPFSTESDETNKKLDKWYEEFRPKVWGQILEKIPNSSKDKLMAGVFHSDDVFFDVKQKGNNFLITPYKVIGGNFVQVIDKNSGICVFYTVFNFRDKLY